mmetsp:Transcript_43809/g.134890  ORF Transcript_43809/g.134890 Transcript_43809/m.134890 type:complete len:291 (+) Transcript_43809:224-1096(+)
MPRTASPAARRTPRASSPTRACALSASRPSSRSTCRRACRLRRRAASTEQAPPRVSSRVLPAGRCWHLDPTRRVLDLSPQRRRSAAASRMSRPRERSAALRRGFFCALTRCRAACRAPVPSLESLRPPWTPPPSPSSWPLRGRPGRGERCTAPHTPLELRILALSCHHCPVPRRRSIAIRREAVLLSLCGLAPDCTLLDARCSDRVYVLRARVPTRPHLSDFSHACVCVARVLASGVFLRSAGSRHVIRLHDMYQTVWTPHRQTECARQAAPIDKTIATRQSPSARGDED